MSDEFSAALGNVSNLKRLEMDSHRFSRLESASSVPAIENPFPRLEYIHSREPMVISRLLPYLSRCTTLQVLKFSGAVEAGQMTSILQKLDFPELSIREILLLDCSSAFQIPHFRSFISFRNLLRFDFQSCDELEIDDEEFAEVVRHLPLLEYLHMSRGGIDDEVDYELVENRLTFACT